MQTTGIYGDMAGGDRNSERRENKIQSGKMGLFANFLGNRKGHITSHNTMTQKQLIYSVRVAVQFVQKTPTGARDIANAIGKRPFRWGEAVESSKIIP